MRNAIFTYGRFQPPHIQHRQLFNQLLDKSIELDAKPFIFTSQKSNKFWNDVKKKSYLNDKLYRKMQLNETFCSFSKNENPIKIKDKLKYLKKIVDSYNNEIHLVDVVKEKVYDPFSAVRWLRAKNFEKIYFYVGLDRAANFINAFNKSPDIEVIWGDRDDNAPSGTSTRELALKNRFEHFKSVIDKNNTFFSDDDIHEIIQNIKDGTKVNNDDLIWMDYNNPDVCKNNKFKSPISWGKDWRRRKTYNTRLKKKKANKEIKEAQRKEKKIQREEESYAGLSNDAFTKAFENLKIGGRRRKKKTRKKRKTRRKWSRKYKKSIDCNNPKGFSQKQYCKYGRRKTRRKR